MFAEHHWRVPDRIYFGLTAFAVLMTAGFVIWAYPELPSTLPIHFGPSGTPDRLSDNKVLTLAFPVMVQLLLTFLISWAYRHPRYFNFPTRRRLESFAPDVQSTLTMLARHVLSMTLLLSSLILSYIALATVMIGLDMTEALDPTVMVFLVLFLLLVNGAYALWMHQVIRDANCTPRPS